MAWEITAIEDRGPGQHYRFRVEGWNTEGEVPREFFWSVPSIGDARYVPHASAGPALRAEIAEAKAATAPRVCLACAREEQARAGFGGIDRVQAGHSCGDPPAIYEVDGAEVDVEDFIRTNTSEDAPALSPEQVEEIRHMMPGDALHLGGGAGETFTLKRIR